MTLVVVEHDMTNEIADLIAQLKDKNWYPRQMAAETLGKMKAEEAVLPLREALRDQNEWVRWTACWALGQIGDKEAAAQIAPLLRDQNESVRQKAAEVLGMLAEAVAVESLVEAVGSDSSRWVRLFAAWALGRAKDKRALKPLVKALRDKEWNVREKAAEALGEMGEKAIEPLAAALKKDNIYVRRSAVAALSKIGGPQAKEVLRQALKDKDWAVREQAQEALKE
ncbi:MAG: HEAT repeat domain-containing protein [Chloroflexi bacterium]|nr:HEAT repeat domain-containing protein [Chloroflexota bacterium]